MRPLPSPLLVVTDRSLFPPPSAGEGGPRSGPGEGSTALSGEVAIASRARSAGILPLRGGRDRRASHPLIATVDSVLAAGGRWVWFRERDMDHEDRMALAGAAMARVRTLGGIFTLGGDAAMAAAIEADGVHLPGGTAPDDIRRARDFLPNGFVGVSAHSVTEVEAAARAGADYCTLSPIFATASKPGYGPALGTGAIRLARACGMPIIALGGIVPETVGDCREAGAAGVAVMGGLMRAADPGTAAAALLRAWDQRPDGP